jgi:hypothetical protein
VPSSFSFGFFLLEIDGVVKTLPIFGSMDDFV